LVSFAPMQWQTATA